MINQNMKNEKKLNRLPERCLNELQKLSNVLTILCQSFKQTRKRNQYYNINKYKK